MLLLILIPLFIIQLAEIIDAVMCHKPEPDLFEQDDDSVEWFVGPHGMEAKSVISREVVRVIQYDSF